jgi:hypothetical protein
MLRLTLDAVGIVITEVDETSPVSRVCVVLVGVRLI